MNDKALNTLEFHKILQMLSDKAISVPGKEMAAELCPTSELRDIARALQETSEAESMILKKGSLPLGGIRDIRASLKKVALGGVLSIEELLHIGDFLYVCKKINSYGRRENKNEVFELLDPLFESVGTAHDLELELNRCIANDKELKDDASQNLASIRRSIKKANDGVRDHLTSIIHSQAYKNMLQDNVITMRGGRYCVPVKQEYRSQFNGMIHDQSSTGATLFMEPTSVVTLNNKIKELLVEEKAEIELILRRLSAMVAEHEPVLSVNAKTLTLLDFIFSKGELSLEMRGTKPIFNDKGYISVRKARHPLIGNDNVVPIDIYLGREFTMLLITGPNTGGKTVSLKTVGLLTLMGQAGLHIPAFDKSELAVFDEVFADIGDEQSIEQSLSTFSSHMTNIVRILDNVTTNSLVLLDELGAGTDPTEGAALAIALLQYLHDLKIRTVVTTHYSELKVFALSTDRVENACCEFDVETLKPTYRLLIGIPGKSNAFAISSKLGLPDHIINTAKTVISREDARFEDVITDLEIAKKSIETEKDRAEQYRRDAELLKQEYEKQKNKLAEQREKLLIEAKTEAKAVLEKARSEAGDIIREMQRISLEKNNFKEAEQKRLLLKEKSDALDEDMHLIKLAKRELRPAPKNLKKGDNVFINSMEQPGVALTAPNSNGDLTVQSGIMKIKVNISDLSEDLSAKNVKKAKPTPVAVTFNNSSKSMFISPEIDLRGLLADEAVARTDKFIDDAILASLNQVRIIHGKGTGALRSAIHAFLKERGIKSFRLGKFGEGEDGVTVVELK